MKQAEREQRAVYRSRVGQTSLFERISPSKCLRPGGIPSGFRDEETFKIMRMTGAGTPATHWLFLRRSWTFARNKFLKLFVSCFPVIRYIHIHSHNKLCIVLTIEFYKTKHHSEGVAAFILPRRRPTLRT